MLRQTPSTSQRTLLALVIGLLLSLGIAVPAAQAQLSLQVTIEDATFDRGAILVSGTVTCSEPTGFTNVSVEVRQPVGRFRSIVGSRFDELGPCADQLAFSLLVAPFSGKFKTGTAFVFANTDGCTPDFSSCDSDSTDLIVDVSK
jgi:hypothetical protein